ncbi:hypothetical protein L1887_54508 [Cichorium endivia]|nr:hypothetical protein L1887_54508 [Cichorium endivia]
MHRNRLAVIELCALFEGESRVYKTRANWLAISTNERGWRMRMGTRSLHGPQQGSGGRNVIVSKRRRLIYCLRERRLLEPNATSTARAAMMRFEQLETHEHAHKCAQLAGGGDEAKAVFRSRHCKLAAKSAQYRTKHALGSIDDENLRHYTHCHDTLQASARVVVHGFFQQSSVSPSALSSAKVVVQLLVDGLVLTLALCCLMDGCLASSIYRRFNHNTTRNAFSQRRRPSVYFNFCFCIRANLDLTLRCVLGAGRSCRCGALQGATAASIEIGVGRTKQPRKAPQCQRASHPTGANLSRRPSSLPNCMRGIVTALPSA